MGNNAGSFRSKDLCKLGDNLESELVTGIWYVNQTTNLIFDTKNYADLDAHGINLPPESGVYWLIRASWGFLGIADARIFIEINEGSNILVLGGTTYLANTDGYCSAQIIVEGSSALGLISSKIRQLDSSDMYISSLFGNNILEVYRLF